MTVAHAGSHISSTHALRVCLKQHSLTDFQRSNARRACKLFNQAILASVVVRGSSKTDWWQQQRLCSTPEGLTTVVPADAAYGDCSVESSVHPDGQEPDLALSLAAAVSLRKVDRAFNLFQQLQAAGTRPPSSATVDLLQLLCRKARFPEAWTVFKSLTPGSTNLSYQAYHDLITAATRAGSMTKALHLFRCMQDDGHRPNLITYCTLISALGSQRRSEGGRGLKHAQRAYELWQELEQSGLALDDGALRAGMNACIQAGELPEAAHLLRQTAAKQQPPDVRSYNILLKGYSRAGRMDKIAALLREMDDAKVQRSTVTFNTLLDAHVRAGQLSEALQVLAEAEAAGCKLDVWAYSVLIKGHVQAGDMAAALAVKQHMQEQGVAPNEVTYTTLVEGYLQDDNIEAAQCMLRQMTENGSQPNAVTYNSLIAWHARQGQTEDAYALLRQMRAAGVRVLTDTFNILMEAAVREGNYPAVVRLFRGMADARCSPDAISYTTLIRAFSKSGRTDDALQAFTRMDDDPSVAVDPPALVAVIDALARGRRMEEAEALLSRAAALAERRGEPPPIKPYSAVIAGYARLRVSRSPHQAFVEMVQPALAVLREYHDRGGDPDGQMFDTVVGLCVRTGNFQHALQVIRTMETAGRHADKGRIKRLMSEFYSRQSRVPGRERLQRPRQKSASAERLKFWLGLPNSYYADDAEQ